MKDENRTQCRYVIHGIKSFRNQIPLELSKQLIWITKIYNYENTLDWIDISV